MSKRELNGEGADGPPEDPRSDEAAAEGADFESVELDAFARSLAELRPRPTRLDRDRLMFLAGQAERDQTHQRRRRLSFAVTTSLGFASAVLVGLLVWRWDPRVVREVRYVNLGPENVGRQNVGRQNVGVHEEPPERTTPAAVPPESVAAGSREAPDAAFAEAAVSNAAPSWSRPNYFQQRQTALTLGVDALRTPVSGGRSLEHSARWEEDRSPPILLEGRSGATPALFEWNLFD